MAIRIVRQKKLMLDSKLTLAKLAELAGVSPSTASRALNNNPLIKQETRDKIQRLARQHNYSVNAAASRLRTRKTHVVAVILNLIENTEQSTTDPFLLKIVGDLNQALNARGYELLLSNSFMASDDWANYFIHSQRADGIIVIGQGKTSDKIDQAAEQQIPMVVWGDATAKTRYPIVGGDNFAGGLLATEHLINQGSKRIMFLGDPGHAEMQERFQGYGRAHSNAQLSLDDDLTGAIDITSKAAYAFINQRIRSKGLDFDGIVAMSDMIALGALKALRERYVGIPGDVAIIGYDDIPLAELMHPSLSTIFQDTQAAAEAMVTQLLNQLDGTPANSQIIDTSLVIRRSSGGR